MSGDPFELKAAEILFEAEFDDTADEGRTPSKIDYDRAIDLISKALRDAGGKKFHIIASNAHGKTAQSEAAAKELGVDVTKGPR